MPVLPECAPSSGTAGTLLRPHYPALDGLRGLAVLCVCVGHYAILAWPGRVADGFFWCFSTIDLFFVLSGFLITRLLLDARPHPRFFRTFYVRRGLRLLPVFVFTWAVLFLIAAFLHPVWDFYNLSFIPCLGNLFMPGGAAGFHTDPSFYYYISASGHRFYVTIGHLWTLSQEEQFYAVWPLVVFLVPSRRALMTLCLVGAALTLVLRIFLFFHADPRLLAGDLLYYSPFTRFDAHFIGAALALYLRDPHFRSLPLSTLRRQSRLLLFGPVGLIVSAYLAFGRPYPLTHHHPLVSTVGFTLDCIAAAGLLLACLDPRTVAARLFAHPLLAPVGRVSYAFYVFHFLPIQFFRNARPALAAHHLLFLIPLTALPLAYLAALLSYRFIEKPFRDLQPRLAPNPATRRSAAERLARQ